MNILVTGGAGFIGSHLVDAYIADGHTVTVFDNLSSGKREHLNSAAVFVEGDITDRAAVAALFDTHGPFDLINHHAAQKSVTRSVAEPAMDAEINILGSLYLLEAAVASQSHHIIFPSTGGVIYGAEVPLPAREEVQVKPISPYGIAKYAVEHYLRYYQASGLTTQVLRYGNVYGPRQDPYGEAGVVAIFSQRIAQDQPMIVYGDGTQIRDFVYIDDIVAANRQAAASDRSGVWNIGTGQETSVQMIADTLRDIAQDSGFSVAPVEYQPARAGELQRSSIDVTKAATELNWQATTSLTEGLKQTFQSFAQVKDQA